MKYTCWGAAKQVTGSMHLLELDNGYTILVDCGIDYEDKTNKEILEGDMPINYFINKSCENKGVSKNNLYTNQNNNKFIFENIYENQIWNNRNTNIPISGPGSSLENTKDYSNLLNKFIYENECKSVLDLGCGDLTWIPKTQFFNDNDIKYIGVDIVESLITSHRKNFPEKLFLCKDITSYIDFDIDNFDTDNFDTDNFDIIIIRDVIFHLKNDKILSIFDNIKNNFKFLIITNCRNCVNTDNFNKWHFSEKNIHIEPFNKSHNFIIKMEEPVFNRDVLIYSHNSFYK